MRAAREIPLWCDLWLILLTADRAVADEHPRYSFTGTYEGRSDGGYIGIYMRAYPPNQSTLNFLCGCFVSLTQDKFDIVQFIPTQIKFLATPLVLTIFIILSFRQQRKECSRPFEPYIRFTFRAPPRMTPLILFMLLPRTHCVLVHVVRPTRAFVRPSLVFRARRKSTIHRNTNTEFQRLPRFVAIFHKRCILCRNR